MFTTSRHHKLDSPRIPHHHGKTRNSDTRFSLIRECSDRLISPSFWYWTTLSFTPSYLSRTWCSAIISDRCRCPINSAFVKIDCFSIQVARPCPAHIRQVWTLVPPFLFNLGPAEQDWLYAPSALAGSTAPLAIPKSACPNPAACTLCPVRIPVAANTARSGSGFRRVISPAGRRVLDSASNGSPG